MAIRFLFATIIAVCISICAFAQKAYNWTGFYIGANAGGSFNNFEFAGNTTIFNNATNIYGNNNTIYVVPSTTRNISAQQNKNTGFTGGFQAGFGQQFQQFYVAAEGDFNYFKAEGFQHKDSAMPPTIVTSGGIYSINRFGQTKWSQSVRARLGYVKERSLIYLTGGYAFANTTIKSDDEITATCCGTAPARTGTIYPPGERMQTLKEIAKGPSFGLGYEWAFSETMSIGIEYRYTKLETDFKMDGIINVINTPVNNSGLSVALGNTDEKLSITDNRVILKFNLRLQQNTEGGKN